MNRIKEEMKETVDGIERTLGKVECKEIPFMNTTIKVCISKDMPDDKIIAISSNVHAEIEVVSLLEQAEGTLFFARDNMNENLLKDKGFGAQVVVISLK